MAKATREKITSKRILPLRVLEEVMDDAAGGTVLFVGSIRSMSDAGRVSLLEYQAYTKMAEKRMKEIEAEVMKKWPVKNVRVVHRQGRLRVGDVSVVVAVSSEHRAEAFEACRYAIDRIKTTLPIWKRERIGRRNRWVEGRPIEA
ncbi:MAG: molybdenum cofactor biosynthesis protein MoaE [Nitrososphaerales archaeon]|nr:molybdenum cofactor biosynthesis protein MoaE [Nitrososphaerales archaeon]